MQPHRIAVIAFDQISPFHLSVPCLVFSEEGSREQGYCVEVCAAEPGLLRTTAGFALQVDYGLEALEQAQTVIMPSWRHADEPPPAALLDALVAAHARGATLVGLCLGAYVLAATGLLDGRCATTHWASVEHFKTRFPSVEVNADVLYLDDHGLLTSAGTAAALDCCLYLLRKHWGAEIANRVARRLVMSPHRQGGQAQFIEQPVPANRRDTRLGELLDWTRATLHLPHTLDSLADKAMMSRRTFTRHFRLLTGTTVSGWLLTERLALSQRLLETTDHPIAAIASLAGFGSQVSLRQHFSKALGVSPMHYRQAFRGQA
ncbi:helix-turn-helix domain-containing protein [Pseudomonas stutzeri]|jgi:transcriptional regulator GlxA family with amidase domain|uniref:helix-turn-helix domain-containing protein n=1 Tax=Stutzerimonas stutzeri TaxID=316 RepID=UPI000C9A2DF5|nr:helix-turn-helix domain-containing protein [Stutzerimonas stutzeri]MCQ4278889.1 helix-turn-helix domain-containing protein [Stutzerimonas stutzeri]PNF74788.1 AraC family transcriptional regulator [Stutzerimonas stutzeri]